MVHALYDQHDAGLDVGLPTYYGTQGGNVASFREYGICALCQLCGVGKKLTVKSPGFSMGHTTISLIRFLAVSRPAISSHDTPPVASITCKKHQHT